MVAKELFVLVFERPCISGCSDKEIRLCKADSFEDAKNIALKHRDMFYKNWSVSINSICWEKDNTAYVYCDYR